MLSRVWNLKVDTCSVEEPELFALAEPDTGSEINGMTKVLRTQYTIFKVKNQKNKMTKFLGNNAASNIILYKTYYLENCVKSTLKT